MAMFVTPFQYGGVQGMRIIESKSWTDSDWDLFMRWSDDQRYEYATDSDGVSITPTEYLPVWVMAPNADDTAHHINYE
jgi:hypothetical protein